MMRRADWLVDVGPGAGEQGGHVVYSGPPEGLASVEESQTRKHLFATHKPAAHTPRKPSRLAAAREDHAQQPA